ncbi:hypothetical protein RIR_jg27285.t1 [Rhizophagus irregularis DAOM 181602=DAOM 197198]|uniref:Uncharacterized protein n=1 Tax=Rhizophagus irregularis (strain DAOM 197198w) TaxID=1432141 RepID=A0A015JUC8_RHIIW|nr:hypothetical protein RirG_195660 [Rhizophagus irregularis DAOM 197198w]GBC52421.1 hypothetical protein RIR_jg27285.t1 [Rhizophagus irregularis DAOM 181602=DAOM 197198]
MDDNELNYDFSGYIDYMNVESIEESLSESSKLTVYFPLQFLKGHHFLNQQLVVSSSKLSPRRALYILS